ASPPAAAPRAAGARRRLLVHFLQQRRRCLLEGLGLAFDFLAIVAAHRRLDLRDRLARRLPLVLGGLVPDILERLFDRVNGRICLVARAHELAELLVLLGM